jgi:hypothetical protein
VKPRIWFSVAAAFFGAAVACIEIGVKSYVNDDHWDKALAAETDKTSGLSGNVS